MSPLEAVLRQYPWFNHPEGMKFVELGRDTHRSLGHWLFQPGEISAFHRLTHCEEIWAIHRGRLLLHVIDDGGALRTFTLGPEIAAGERPIATVPRGAWQAAELPPNEPFAFGTNVCAPAFVYEHLQFARRDELLAAAPDARDIVQRLTRTPH
jgi:predicted cupin superfamily sugar epimerase